MSGKLQYLAVAGLALVLTGGLFDGTALSQKKGGSKKKAGPTEKMFEVQNISQQAADCGEPQAPCATVNIRVPSLVSGTNENARDAINGTINRLLGAGGNSGKGPQTPEVLAYEFLSEYERNRAEDPTYRTKWTMEKNFSIVRNDGKVLSMSFSDRRYTGGDGTTEVLTFANFRLEDGSSLKLTDLFVEGYDLKLVPLGEQKFRTLKRIKPGKSFSESGYTFDGDRFQLTDNFSITPTGLRFHWNRNEIASGPNGVTDIVFDWKSITELLKPEGMALLGIVPKPMTTKP
jgi:hypothetical protein